ncbi:SpoIIE family protein phosphatase [Nodosilinea sp. P-1105]|uniref:PP2C family protein-serine/threonine phosphatase n=1 Tax=Nodosilinea sp. P-1105 TaxID=2546229 RepID=UPI00146B4639|nr:SpoIIE family protein phosphatase [Nodosilinea sp. P-1105]NMF85965.1 response regulator [Nodosilinea sp. P-1105]
MTDILVIEHDASTEQFLVNALQQQGYGVITARNGAEGLDLAEQLLPGVIICDWSIPGEVDGLAICRALKHHPVLSTTSLLLLTTRYSTADRVKGLEMGADDLLSKPVDINELNARVRAGLRLYQLTQDLRRQKQRMEAELAEAETYVRSLLPPDQEGKVPIQSRFLPSQQLGGDCYDYYWLDPDYLVMYLLDVSGHGLGSALLSTSVLNVLRSQSLPDVSFYRPEKVLKALNETFQMSDQNQKYFTIWYGVLNCANRQLLYASAGHPPAVLVSMQGDQVSTTRLRTPGLPVGMLPDASYQWQRCNLPPSSSLYVFSDGLYEVLQRDQQYFGLEAFVDLLAVAKRQKSIDHILQSVIQRQASTVASDDMSLMMITLD